MSEKNSKSNHNNYSEEGILFDQLEVMVNAASKETDSDCPQYNHLVESVKFLIKIVRKAFITQVEIREILEEVKRQQADIIRMRKVFLWAATVIGGAILVKFGAYLHDSFLHFIGFR